MTIGNASYLVPLFIHLFFLCVYACLTCMYVHLCLVPWRLEPLELELKNGSELP